VREAALAQAEARGLEAPARLGGRGRLAPRRRGHRREPPEGAHHRPAVVIGFDGDEGKGSGRSVAGVDLGASIQRLAAEGLIAKGGGHKMAAGLSLTPGAAGTGDGAAIRASGAPGRGQRRGRRPAPRRCADARGRHPGPDRADRGGGPLRRLGPCPALRLSGDAHPHDPARGRRPSEAGLFRRTPRAASTPSPSTPRGLASMRCRTTRGVPVTWPAGWN
jgi:hypothetical protein